MYSRLCDLCSKPPAIPDYAAAAVKAFNTDALLVLCLLASILFMIESLFAAHSPALTAGILLTGLFGLAALVRFGTAQSFNRWNHRAFDPISRTTDVSRYWRFHWWSFALFTALNIVFWATHFATGNGAGLLIGIAAYAILAALMLRYNCRAH